MFLSEDTSYLLVLFLLQVSVVGVVRECSPLATSVRYSVDDMTGPPLNVKQWVNTEASGSSPLCSGLQMEKLPTGPFVVNDQFQISHRTAQLWPLLLRDRT